MFRKPFLRYHLLWCAHIPGLTPVNQYDNPDLMKKREPVTGLERVKALFQLDKDGEVSKELVSTYQVTLGSTFLLGFYGGSKHSKHAFEEYVDMNHTTTYISPYEAKKKLHDYVFVKFFKHFLIYAAKGAVFSLIFMTTLYSVAAFRNKNGILEFTAAGLLTGTFMRIHYGLKGMLSGAIVGTGVATIAGVVFRIIGMLSSSNLESFSLWQKDVHLYRTQKIREGMESMEKDRLNSSLQLYRKSLIQNEDEDEEKIFVLVNPNQTPDSDK